jgi:MGT family glycosyltransferase
MSPILFVTWPGGGNLTPVASLGRQLVDRGHGVRVVSTWADLTERFAPEGIGCRRGDHTTLAADLRSSPADVVIVDFMMPEVLSLLETQSVPTVALVHTLFQPTADGEMNLIGAFTPLERLNEVRAGLGLEPVEHMLELLDRLDRVLVCLPDGFDRRVADGDHGARYVGPLLEEEGHDADWAPPPGNDPLVVVALGTTPMGEAPLLQRVLDALAPLPVRVVANAGDHLEPSSFTVPANATLTGYVRHAAVLPHASLVVTHAGLGTISSAAAHGVPLVCIPIDREQPANAARVAELGLGVDLGKDPPLDDIRSAVVATLGDITILDNAAVMREHIAPYLRDQVAVREVEALLR